MANFLLISYHFHPKSIVGANRLNYWAKYLETKTIHNVAVFTATSFTDEEKLVNNQIKITDTNRKGFLGYLIKDAGLSWQKDIVDYVNKGKYKNRPDFVIISGSPFMHFGLAKFFKVKFSSKVILDYRDPFAKNPRFNQTPLIVSIKRYFERGFNKNADYVISVNEECLALLGKNKKNQSKFLAIPNGFDDIAISKVNSTDFKERKNLIVYPGKFYPKVSEATLLEAFQNFISENNDWRLKFIGANENQNKIDGVSFTPQRPYIKVMETLFTAKVGLIFTGGQSFESTTKIFDYVAANLWVIIITNGQPKTGNINELISSYPNTIWVKNNKIEILNALKRVSKEKLQPFDGKMKFSRKVGFDKLLKTINA